MNRPTKAGWLKSAPLLALLALLGCGSSSWETRYMEIVPQEKLRTIEAFEPASMTVEAPAGGGEAAKAPPREVPLTLAECRAAALRRNLDLSVTLVDPLLAAEIVRQQQAVFEPFLFANARYAKTDEPVLFAPLDPLARVDLLSSKSSVVSGDAGVEVPLRTGGTLTFDLPASRADVEGADVRKNPAYATGFSADFSQPLLRGGGTRANTYQILVAGLQDRSIQARTKLEVMRVLAAVDRVYWQLYAARRQLDVRINERDLAVAQFERARRMAAAGSTGEVDVVRAATGVADAAEAIIAAENVVRQRDRDLKRALQIEGLEVGSNATIIPATEPDPAAYTFDTPRLVESALANRMELVDLELQIAQDAATIDFQRNAALPVLALDYRYEASGAGGSLEDSVELLGEKRFENHTLALQLVVPLGNRAARSRVREAVLRKLQRLATRAQRVEAVRQEVLGAVDAVETAWQQVVANRQRVTLAQRTLEAEVRQFTLGLRTSTDVTQAQNRLANAQSAEIGATTGYEVALVDLAYATGTLLGEDSVRWTPRTPQE